MIELKKYEVVYYIYYIFYVILVILAQNFDIIIEPMITFSIEILFLLIFMLHPQFLSKFGITLPIIGMLINFITSFIMVEINSKYKLKVDIVYLSNMISVILNLIVNTFIILEVTKKNKEFDFNLNLMLEIEI